MKSYLDLLAKIMDRGVTVQTGAFLPSENRQPTARRLHAETLSFDLSKGFPAVTTKPLWWRAVCAEWIWFMRGSGDGQYLIDQKVDSIWRSWFKPGTTDLGPCYSVQFRHMLGVRRHDRAIVETDQVASAVADIRAVVANPFDRARRRIIISLWNPAQVADMALPPCHTFYLFDLEPPRSVDGAGRWTLSLYLVARSIDAVKGLPFNIASAALFCHVMAAVTGTRPGTLTITFNDVHIYDNQFENVREQLQRSPLPLPSFTLEPTGADPAGTPDFLEICPDLSIEQAHKLTSDRFKLIGYVSHPKLSRDTEVAV